MTDTRTAADQARQDDGYFGPDSISWRLFADPSSKLGGVAAVLLQALNPNMIRLFDAVSNFATDGQGRAERTARYIDTTIFGDKAHADAASKSIARMHAHAVWTDPSTGETLRADTPAWLEWTHNTVSWGVLAAAEAFGPELTPAEKDAFVTEQLIAARLAGCDPSNMPATRDDLFAYIDGQKDWLALTLPAATLSRDLRKPSLKGNPLHVWTGIVMQDAILSIMPDWATTLYGIEGRPMNLRSAGRVAKRMLGAARRSTSYEDVITGFTTRVDTHPYRRVRARS